MRTSKKDFDHVHFKDNEIIQEIQETKHFPITNRHASKCHDVLCRHSGRTPFLVFPSFLGPSAFRGYRLLPPSSRPAIEHQSLSPLLL